MIWILGGLFVLQGAGIAQWVPQPVYLGSQSCWAPSALTDTHTWKCTHKTILKAPACGRKSCVAPNWGFSGQCPHSTSEDSSPRFSSTPGHPAGREGLSHLSSGEFPGADTHPLPIRGSQVSGLGKLWHVLTGKPWLSFPPCPGSSWRFSSLDLHISSEGPKLCVLHHPLQGPIYTKLQLSEALQKHNTTKNSKNPYRPSGKGRRCAAWGESDCREELSIFLQQ